MNEAGCPGTAEPGVGKEGEFPVEYSLIGVGKQISEQLDSVYGEGTVDHIVASETVGAKVGNQLKVDGAMSMLYAILLIFLFVMIRFDLRFAPGGIVALTHDAIIVVGAFAVTYKEFNLQTIAALLTIIGYSINDTIVVFDRVRERVALDRDAPIEETTNRALNETLSRTVLTSGTTMLVILSTWVLGSGPIKDFSFALFIGIVVGTYSSLFVAAPVFLYVNTRFYQGRGHLKMADGEEREGTGALLGVGGGEVQQHDIGHVSGPGGELDQPGTGGTAAAGTGGGEKKARRRRRRRPAAGQTGTDSGTESDSSGGDSE
jgi:preprotein translocase subunit SecF